MQKLSPSAVETNTTLPGDAKNVETEESSSPKPFSFFSMSNTIKTKYIFDPVEITFQQYNISQTHPKFLFLKNILDHLFLTEQHKKDCIDRFCKIQKVYHAMSRLAFIFRYKNAHLYVDKDMYMNNLTLEQKNVICVYDKKIKYLFTTTDLINIVNSALCNSPYFYATPLPIKNPWNNLPFDKSTLYNIYFFVKRLNSVVPLLFQNFFLSSFSLNEFKNKNEELIRDRAIENYVNTNTTYVLYTALVEMVYENNYKKKMRIHRDFPKDKLVFIMRPYLMLFYKSKYSLRPMDKVKYAKLLREKMKEFIIYNPKFGRKTIDIANTPVFNEMRPIFNMKKKNKDLELFSKSHLSFDDNQDESEYVYEEDEGYDSY
jgi:hypothetical protein